MSNGGSTGSTAPAAPSGSRVRVRFPTLEIFASESGGMLSVNATPLTPAEQRLAQDVFERSLDLSPIRIVQARVAAAPTTLGNNIRTNGPMSNGTLIHELTHIWQYQNLGTSYISDSAFHQVAGMISAGSRNAAYTVRIVPGQRFTDYQAEHQAMIVEQWFTYPQLRTDLEYSRLIGQVRAARPLPQQVRRTLTLEEAAYGPGMSTQRLLPPGGREFELRGEPTVPLLRIEF